MENAEALKGKQVARIMTSDFPTYFVLVTRHRIEMREMGTEGGSISSSVVPEIQAVVPAQSLVKQIRIGIQAIQVHQEVVERVLGASVRLGFSAILTIEPRRRKFHKPITLAIPVSKAYKQENLNQEPVEAQTLRLLCSITGIVWCFSLSVEYRF